MQSTEVVIRIKSRFLIQRPVKPYHQEACCTSSPRPLVFLRVCGEPVWRTQGITGARQEIDTAQVAQCWHFKHIGMSSHLHSLIFLESCGSLSLLFSCYWQRYGYREVFLLIYTTVQ